MSKLKISGELEDMVRQIVIEQSRHKIMNPAEVFGFYHELRNLLASSETDGKPLNEHVIGHISEPEEPAQPVSQPVGQVQVSTPVTSLRSSDEAELLLEKWRASFGELPEKVESTARLFAQADPSVFDFEKEKIKDTLGHRSLRFDETRIFCLECGKWAKLISKPHLAKHGLTTDEYRDKWKIDADYPLVSRAFRDDRRIQRKPDSAEDDPAQSVENGVRKRIRVEEVAAAPKQISVPSMPLSREKSLQNPAIIAGINTINSKHVELPDGYKDLSEDDSIGIKSLLFDPEHILCLECGNYMKLISKPHLKTHGLDPAGYRAKWNIPTKMGLVSQNIRDQKKQFFVEHKIWETRHPKKEISQQEDAVAETRG